MNPEVFDKISAVMEYVERALGEYAMDYDIEAIAREIAVWDGDNFVLGIEDPDDRFWEIAAKHEHVRTKSEFRALREMVGLTQQRLADDLGVKVLSVKRWESMSKPQTPPKEAWDILDMLVERQDEAVRSALSEVERISMLHGGSPHDVAMPYWTSEEDYRLYHYLPDNGDESWTEINATSRRVACALRDWGIRVKWVDGKDNAVPKMDSD